MPSILIIDDDSTIAGTLSYHFTSQGWEASKALSGEEGITLAEKSEPDIILLDMKLPDLNGKELLKRLIAQGCTASVIIMTGWGSIADAVDTIKLGAEQYLTKPIDLAELSALTNRIIETKKLRIENRYYQHRTDHPVVGASTEIYRLHHMIDLMAENSDTTVLLLGESGTGKELVAREMHRRSARQQRPFLDINCAAIAETLLESEMFGHERGAFTDARERKLGLLEVADGGTVFLDEIGEMPLSVQPKLLRVLETRTFKRVGGTREIRVQVRIIAATNQDLAKAVGEGRFREDLYYRIKVFPVSITPLRERPGDIPILVNYFIHYYNTTLKKSVTGVTVGAMDFLRNYSWPGNVRELRNVIERAIVLSKSAVMNADMLPQEIIGFRLSGQHASPHTRKEPLPAKTLNDVERDYIEEVLSAHKGNRSTTARVLGIARSTLLEKLKKFGLEEKP